MVRQLIAKLKGDERGSSGLELLISAPVIILCVLFIAFAGGSTIALAQIQNAASVGARAASLARTPAAIVSLGQTSSLANLTHLCTSDTSTVSVHWNTAGSNGSGPAGYVVDQVTCTISFVQIVPGLPGSLPITRSAAAPMDSLVTYGPGVP